MTLELLGPSADDIYSSGERPLPKRWRKEFHVGSSLTQEITQEALKRLP